MSNIENKINSYLNEDRDYNDRHDNLPDFMFAIKDALSKEHLLEVQKQGWMSELEQLCYDCYRMGQEA